MAGLDHLTTFLDRLRREALAIGSKDSASKERLLQTLRSVVEELENEGRSSQTPEDFQESEAISATVRYKNRSTADTTAARNNKGWDAQVSNGTSTPNSRYAETPAVTREKKTSDFLLQNKAKEVLRQLRTRVFQIHQFLDRGLSILNHHEVFVTPDPLYHDLQRGWVLTETQTYAENARYCYACQVFSEEWLSYFKAHSKASKASFARHRDYDNRAVGDISLGEKLARLENKHAGSAIVMAVFAKTFTVRLTRKAEDIFISLLLREKPFPEIFHRAGSVFAAGLSSYRNFLLERSKQAIKTITLSARLGTQTWIEEESTKHNGVNCMIEVLSDVGIQLEQDVRCRDDYMPVELNNRSRNQCDQAQHKIVAELKAANQWHTQGNLLNRTIYPRIQQADDDIPPGQPWRGSNNANFNEADTTMLDVSERDELVNRLASLGAADLAVLDYITPATSEHVMLPNLDTADLAVLDYITPATSEHVMLPNLDTADLAVLDYITPTTSEHVMLPSLDAADLADLDYRMTPATSEHVMLPSLDAADLADLDYRMTPATSEHVMLPSLDAADLANLDDLDAADLAGLDDLAALINWPPSSTG